MSMFSARYAQILLPFWDRAVIFEARVNAELHFLLENIEALSGLQFAI